jgi:integrase
MEQKTAIVNNEDIDTIINVCKTKFEKETILILLRTGMHINVLCHPKKYSVSIEGGVLKWRRPKTKKWIKLRVHNDIKDFVDDYIRAKKKYSRQYYWLMVKNIGKRVKMDFLSPQNFRHTCAFNLMKQGKTPAEVATLLGCSQKVLWDNYLLLNPDEVVK